MKAKVEDLGIKFIKKMDDQNIKDENFITNEVRKAVEEGFKPMRSQMNLFFTFASILVVALAAIVGYSANLSISNKEDVHKNDDALETLIKASVTHHPENLFLQELYKSRFPYRGSDNANNSSK